MKNKINITLIFLMVIMALISPIFSEDLDKKGLEIAQIISESNDGFKGEHTQGELFLFDANKNKVVRKFEFYAKEIASGDRNLSRILWPLDAKGITLLSWTNLNRDNDQWLFLPAMNKVRRLNSSNQKGAFLGSEFSYEDIASQLNHVDTYKFSYFFKKDGVFNSLAPMINWTPNKERP